MHTQACMRVLHVRTQIFVGTSRLHHHFLLFTGGPGVKLALSLVCDGGRVDRALWQFPTTNIHLPALGHS